MLSDLDRAEYSLLLKTPACDFLRHPQVGVNGLFFKHFKDTQRCGLVMSLKRYITVFVESRQNIRKMRDMCFHGRLAVEQVNTL